MAALPSKRIVVTRFSAMGDVILLLPVIRSVLDTHPDLEIILVTRPHFAPLFQDIPRLQVHAAQVNDQHKGLRGLWRLFQEVKIHQPTHWIDAHDVIRTQVLRFLAKRAGIPVTHLDKGRDGKRKWTQKANKQRPELPAAVDRYLACFQRHGFGPSDVSPQTPYFSHPSQAKAAQSKRIGIAPFAQHTGKRWLGYPELIQKILDYSTAEIWVFGGGKQEKEAVEAWGFSPQRVKNTIGRYSLSEEISWIQSLDLMVANDSSNLHLATLSGIPTISIWGATHPGVGFGPWPAQKAVIVQVPVDDLPCRPCSVFGQKKCFRGDYACLTQISPDQVFQKVKALLSLD